MNYDLIELLIIELDNHSGKWQFFQILRFFRKIVRSKCDLHLELYLSTLPLSGSRDSFNEWPNTSRHKLTRPWTSIRITFLNWISASPSRPKAKVPRYPTVINPGLPTPPETPEAPTDNAPEVEPAAVIFESVSSGFSSSSEKQFQLANLLEGKTNKKSASFSHPQHSEIQFCGIHFQSKITLQILIT